MPKRSQDRYESWRNPMMAVQVWGPAWDMSMTSNGYFMEVLETGKMMRSTVIVVPTGGLAIADQQLPEPVPEVPTGEADVASVSYAPSILEDDKAIDDMLPRPEAEETPEEPPSDLVMTTGDQVVLELQQPPPGDRGVPVHDPPRKRLTGKQTPRPGQREMPPTLRALQAGGEWDHQELAEIEEFETERWEEKLEELMVYEHSGLLKWARGERLIAKDEEEFFAVKQAEAIAAQLEEALERKVRVKKLESQGATQEEEEVLQTRVVPLEEVRQDLQGWKEAFEKEYRSLVDGPVKPITSEEVKKMEERGVKIEVLPAKAIASKKPPNRRKGRVVVCGNYATERDHQDVSVGGVCAMTVRGVVHAAACDDLALGSIDVSGAFLQAPRRETKVVTIVQPPRLLQLLDIVSSDERWLVECALYGMIESPGDWAAFRNSGLKVMSWTWNKVNYWLERTPEQHLWKVKKQGAEGSTTAGWIAVYVDDFLVAMKSEEIGGAFQAIKNTWKCSQEEMVSAHKSMRFCGYEIKQTETGGYYIKQEGYLRDLLDKYQVTGSESQPIPKIEDEEDELDPPLEEIRRAQTIVGELQWIAQRTRPDVAYGIGVLSRLIHRRPGWVNQTGQYLLRYLNGTPALGLRYEKVDRNSSEMQEMKVLADTSFGPPHEKYRSVQAVVIEHGSNVLAWESSRQAFVTQSTAEAELLGYNEGYQMGEAAASLLSVLEMEVNRKLQGDCKAALAQILGDTGPWRTRHLRLRSAKLREALREPTMKWSAEHKNGCDLSADGLTKALQGRAFEKFVSQLRMESCTDHFQPSPQVAKFSVGKRQTATSVAVGACLVAGLAMVGVDVTVASLLLATGYLLREVVGRAMQSPEDPQQDRNRTLQKKLQKDDIEGTPYGFDRSGTVPLSAGAGILQVGRNPQGHEKHGRSPGIRAFRVPPVRVGSHGSSEASSAASSRPADASQSAGGYVANSGPASSSARARGRDAMGWHERRSGSREDQPSVPNQRDAVLVDVNQLQEMLQNLTVQSARDSLQGDCEREGEAATSSEAAGSDADTLHQQPWLRPQFRTVNRASKDKWCFTLRKEGWLVRVHHKTRVQRFHPVHSSTPIDCAELEPRRVTIKVWPEWQVEEDQWTNPTKDKSSDWIGYTFFKIVQVPSADYGFELVGP